MNKKYGIPSLSICALALSIVSTCSAGDTHVTASASFLSLDTGELTEHIWAPKLQFDFSLDSSSKHTIGFSISTYDVDKDDSVVPPYPNIDLFYQIDTSYDVDIDQYEFIYRFRLGSESNRFQVYVSPSIGASHESGIWQKQYFSYIHTDAEPLRVTRDDWNITLGGAIQLEYDLSNKISVRAGFGYINHDVHHENLNSNEVFYSKLEGYHSDLGINCRF